MNPKMPYEVAILTFSTSTFTLVILRDTPWKSQSQKRKTMEIPYEFFVESLNWPLEILQSYNLIINNLKVIK